VRQDATCRLLSVLQVNTQVRWGGAEGIARNLFQEYVYPDRMHTILGNISLYKPELVLMYGMDNINLLKKSVEELFPAANFKMGRAIKGQIPQHHQADVDGTILLITTQVPALKHNRVETGFDWYGFGKLVKAH